MPGLWIEALLRAYAQPLFAHSSWAGAVFAAATFVEPRQGFIGLTGCIAATATALLLQAPRDAIRRGEYGFNGLLVGLALGLMYKPDLPAMAILVLAASGSTLVAFACRGFLGDHLGLPFLSVPFVLVTLSALLAAKGFSNLEITLGPMLAARWADSLPVPAYISTFLRSLGAVFFQVNLLSGIIVFLGLLFYSPLTLLLAIVGYSAGNGLYSLVGGPVTDISRSYLGFNFLLTSIALGGVWVVMSWRSIIFAAFAAAGAALLTAACRACLSPLDLPVLAAPFNIAVLVSLYSLKLKGGTGAVRPVDFAPGRVEDNLRAVNARTARVPADGVPRIELPVRGTWTVTQGFDGKITHKGQWRHGLDLEVMDASGKPYSGNGLHVEDYHAYNLPILSPVDGVVSAVKDGVPDNPVGEINTEQNWGNLVTIWLYGDLHVTLCHLRAGSIKVKPGDRVRRGQGIASCGSSGRSPQPHLHVQVQHSATAGGTTTYFEVAEWVKVTPDGPELIPRGVPEEGTALRRIDTNDILKGGLDLATGRTFKFKVRSAGSETVEEWCVETDLLGRTFLESRPLGDRLYFSITSDSFWSLSFEGSRHSGLYALFVAATKIPLDRDPALTWKDRPATSLFLGPMARIFRDMALPFTDPFRVEAHGSFGPLERIEIAGLSMDVMPVHVEVTSRLRLGGRGKTWKAVLHLDKTLGPARLSLDSPSGQKTMVEQILTEEPEN